MVDAPSEYPMLGLVQVVPFARCKQYPSVPKVISPVIPSSARDAFKKKTDLKYGTEKVTMPRRTAAASVTRKPGVAGFQQAILHARAGYGERESDGTRTKAMR